MRLVNTLCLLLAPFFILAQGPVADQIKALKSSGATFEQFDVVSYSGEDLSSRSLNGLAKGTLVNIQDQVISDLVASKEDLVTMDVPYGRSTLSLDLVRYELLARDFQLFTSGDPETPVAYEPGIYYRGIISGNPNSLATVSVFNDEIMAIISFEEGNVKVAKLKDDRANTHIVYNDKDLQAQPDWECEMPDTDIMEDVERLKYQQGSRDPGDCVRVYIEIDDDIVANKGGATGATNYITGLFNEVITLYANESIEMSVSEIFAWTTNSPYNSTSSSGMLSAFQNNTGAFNGDLAHLVSYKASGGIAAGFDGVCNSNPDNSKCFSSIDASYAQVPTYSWSVMVTTHEMGHLLGSRHTHACVWNGNNTAIDGCAGSTEGFCPLPGNPSGGGTIMSYCHLQSVGINFNNGFGPQPGDVIRNTVNASGNCLTACDGPPPPPEYCSANGTNQNYEFIQAVSLNTISNNSGNNGGYGDFTSQSTSLNAGSSYTITLTPGFTGSAYNEAWGVWIDYNNDLDFSDAGEQVATGSSSSTLNLSFTVPSSSPESTTRMRVAMQYNSAPPVCGSFTYGEVEDYTVVIGGGAAPTCDDGIQNGDEEGIDCGGSQCPACPTCDDGIQNGDEEGVDCGGSNCPACPTCDDGIQNGQETGVDCGGPDCPACPTCDDGIQNGDEEGVDCGGSCPNDCPGGGGGTLFAHFFESGWDGWQDGGSDCFRYAGSRSWEGSYSIRLRDNSGTASAMTSSAYDVSGAASVEIEFYFYPYSMENGEDFWVLFYDGSNWNLVAAYARGTSFENNNFYVATVTLSSADYNFPSNARFRFQCDASGNQDQIYIDAVTVTTNGGSALVQSGQTIDLLDSPAPAAYQEIPPHQTDDRQEDLNIFPNPTTDRVNFSMTSEITRIRVVSMGGVEMHYNKVNNTQYALDVDQWAPGMYVAMIESQGEWVMKKFIVQ